MKQVFSVDMLMRLLIDAGMQVVRGRCRLPRRALPLQDGGERAIDLSVQ